MSSVLIGTDIFVNFMENDGYYVDKSLFVKEVLECKSQVLLITRPRRFGKTLNMTMLDAFLSCNNKRDYTKYFQGLKIWNEPACRERFQKSPTVFLTLKGISCLNWNDCIASMCNLISMFFKHFTYLFEGLDDVDKKRFNKILSGNPEFIVEFSNSLSYLIKWLYDYHGQKAFLIIDEYDNPIHEGYQNGYYREIIAFMQVFFGEAMKTNPYLDKAVMTGVTKIAGESLFSKFNNFASYNIKEKSFADKFGFTEDDVNAAVGINAPNRDMRQIRDMYNGYLFGGVKIYNPWSIINMLSKDDDVPLGFYWYNSSSDRLLRDEFAKKDMHFKEVLNELTDGATIRRPIKDETTYMDLSKSGDAVWSFLLYSGYLSLAEPHCDENNEYALKIPNKEVRFMMKDIVKAWFVEWSGSGVVKAFFATMLEGDAEMLGDLFKNLIENAFSYFDTSRSAPERMYHAFILGMMQFLRQDYYYESNANMGRGRSDLFICPKSGTYERIGAILEFKKTDREENLEGVTDKALEQIFKRGYVEGAHRRGLETVHCYGIGFYRNEFIIKLRTVNV